MKAGIAIDAWKLSIFDRHLTKAGYAYEKGEILNEVLLLTVETQDASALAEAVKAAQTEAKRAKMQ